MKREDIYPEGEKDPKTGEPAKSKFYLVYVDDEKDLLDPVRFVASQFGLKTFCTTSVDEALKFISERYFEIASILSDYKMELTSGFSFREKVLEIAPEIPFSILSGHVTREMAIQGVELKVSSFLDKPITETKFSEILTRDGITRIRSLKEDQDLLNGFLDEADANLEKAEELALSFEANPNDMEAVNKCFGLVHTLKGASGYFRPKTLHHFIHRFEDLLKRLQRGEQSLNPEVVSSILASFDFVKVLIHEFKTREHSAHDLDSICKKLFEFKSESHFDPRAASEPKPQVEFKPKGSESEKQSDLRVPVLMLDKFMQSSGEMTVIRNMINKCVRSIETQMPGNRDVSMLGELLEELHEINSGIQTQITNLRKVSVKNILKPINRVVRDVSKSLGKEAELIVHGDELAVDTAVAEVLTNSLVHLVRNSLDHGLEGPNEREKTGKSRKGKVTITSTQKNELIQVQIEDDGRGINEVSIQRKLVKNGTHTEAQASQLSKDELYGMIFEAGFSTAEKVTDVSGRGVGMSMVKDSVKSIGGRIEIESFLGQGSKFTLHLPVPKSVLIRDCLFIHSQNMQFGILQDDVLRVVRITNPNDPSLFKTQNSLNIDYNGELVPIINLSSLLQSKPETEARKSQETLNLVVVGSRNRKLALQVDEILDIEDTVIKPLQYPIKKIEAYQGAAYMGDGSIGLILSTDGLLNLAGINALSHRKSPTHTPHSELANHTSERASLLLFHVGDQSIYGLPDNQVFRIEEVATTQIQYSGGAQVVPYRDKLMTLIDLRSALSKSPVTELSPTQLQTIVIKKDLHYVGLIVKTIDDITETTSELVQPLVYQTGNAGNYRVGEKTITLLNLPEILDIAVKENQTQSHVTRDSAEIAA